jgi:hypothetical protein
MQKINELTDGQEERVTFQLSDDEKHFVAHAHGRHISCELTKCNVHHLIHLIIRLEAGWQKLKHDLDATEPSSHSGATAGQCERCKWKDLDWLTHMAGEWGHQ